MIVALEPVVVAPWTSGPAVDRHDAIWSAWLHGSVAAIHNYGRLVLMVPVAALTPAVTSFAMRLYEVGSFTILD